MRHIMLLVCLVALAACGAEETERGGPPPASPVVPFTVDYAEDRRSIQAVGTARARAATVLQSETAGVVEEISFAPGDFIEAGDPVMRLEDDDEDLAVKLAAVAVREAEQLLERYRRIEDTGAVSDTQIDEARTQLEAARIQLSQAQLRLDERTLRAPFPGYVGISDLDPGTRVTAGQDIVPLDDRRLLFIDFTVPEDVFGQLREGDFVEVSAFAEGDRVRSAEIINVDSRVDPTSRSFRARAALQNEDDALRPGMSFEVRFSVPGNRYPMVPEASIVWGTDGSYLWAVRDGKATQVPVQIVSRREGRVLVSGDIPRGAVIVAEGVQKVREGSAVTLVANRDGTVSTEDGVGG
jgi:RND family efflux transporter MFP subunit